MDILPLKLLQEEDVAIAGSELVALAKLKQLNFPVPDGLVIFPPKIHLKTLLEHYQYKNKEIFEQSLEIIKKDLLKIPLPESLTTYKLPKGVNINSLWRNLLQGWLEEIRSNLWREGFSKPLENLSAQPVLFTGKLKAVGEAYLDPELKKIVITDKAGLLTLVQQQSLETLIRKATQKLFIPFIFSWILDKEIQLVQLVPFTQNMVISEEEKIKETQKLLKKEDLISLKSAVRVFLNLSADLTVQKNIDGIIIQNDDEKKDLDLKKLQLVESALTMESKPVIYMLPPKSFNLLHNQTSLANEAETFLFARNKKGLLNVALGISAVRSTNDFMQLKRALSVLGITRKGSLKIWLEISLPENLINLGDYIEVGFDGAILNLDQLTHLLGGANSNPEENIFYGYQVKTLTKFIDDAITLLNKAHLPILIKGQVALYDDLLRFLLKKGVFGVVVNSVESQDLKQQINFLENQHIKNLSL